MKNENKIPEINKDQLYPERSFIEFCLRDQFHGRKIQEDITKEFLDACEKDTLLMPLLTQKEVTKNDDGVDEEMNIRYYSPFQIYLAARLATNKIDKEGQLRGGGFDWEYQEERNTRYIDWGEGGSFNVDLYKKRKQEGEEAFANPFVIAEDFHNFLRLLHGLEAKDSFRGSEGRARLFMQSPRLEYNLDVIKKEKVKYLNSFNLNIEKLKILVKNIGQFTSHVDPLEHWFYYLKRHLQWRKDKLKGAAALAQDLYGLCDIAYDVIEAVSGEKLPPLLSYIHESFKPFLMEGPQYASGHDIRTLHSVLSKLEEWVNNNKDLISEAADLSTEGKIIETNIEEQINKAKKALSDFETRYGDRRYTGNPRTVAPEEKLKLEDLDDQTRECVEMIMKQRGVSEEEYEVKIKTEITFAIEHRLDDLARLVSEPEYQIANALWPLRHKIERDQKINEPQLWTEFNKTIDPQAPDYMSRRANFWQKEFKELQKPYTDKLQEIDTAQEYLYKIGRETMQVFCAVCRKEFVLLHYDHNDRQVSNEAVCDDCFNSVSQNALQATSEDWKKIKYAEWKCDNCGERTLYKFALENTISLWARGDVPIKVELNYGQVSLEAKCPGCGQISKKSIDWGWQL